jgi:branched-chain amino acid transport system ATP-binding protein
VTSPVRVLRELGESVGPVGLFPLFVLLAVAAVERFDFTAFGVLGPEIRHTFHLTNSEFAPIATFTGVLPLLLAVHLGWWSDRSHRVNISRLGGLVWGVTAVLTGLAPALAVLVIARLAGGSGQLVNEVVHPSLLSDYYEPRSLPSVFSAYRMGSQGVALVAGALAGGLGGAIGWRGTFVVLALPTFLLVAVMLRLREPARGQSLGMVTRADDRPPLGESYRRLRAVRSLRRTWAAAFFFGGGTASFATYLSLFLNDVYHVKPLTRGVVTSLFGLAGLAGLAYGGKLAQDALRKGTPDVLPVINGLMIVEFGAGVMLMAAAPGLVLSVIAVCLLSIGAFGFLPAYQTLVALVVPPRLRSQAFAWSLLWYLLGAILFSGIVGLVADAHGQRVALGVLGVAVGIGGWIAVTARSWVAHDVAQARKNEAAADSDALLVCRGLDVAYEGGVQVLFDVDFEVRQGEVIALLGTNGAGKSTLLRAISGLLDPIGGAIFFEGRDIAHADAVTKAAAGIVHVPGGRGVFPGLTVAENLKIAGWLQRHDRAGLEAATERVLGYFPILRDFTDVPAANLSGGQQQMLTIAQALLTRPRLLMIDELSLGLAPVIVEQLLATVRRLADDGTTIILVEQSVNIALTVADTAYFMEKGEIRFHGPTAELLDRPDVLRSVFLEGAHTGNGGRRSLPATPARARRNGKAAERPVVLEVVGLTKRFGGVVANDDITFTLRQNEILGVIGPNGAGKTTLFDIVSGFTPPDGGRVLLHDLDITTSSPDVRARLGLGRSFQDARLFPGLTVADTVALALEQHVQVRDPLAAALNLPAVADSEAAIRERVDELVDLMGIGAFYDKFVSELSTGSRRIVDLACILAQEPDVILFDEPSSGIAQRETEALGPLLQRIREATGASLLLIEHDMRLVTSISDEILALDLGHVVTRGRADVVVADPRVVASYLGGTEVLTAPKPAGRRTNDKRTNASRRTKNRA